MSLWNIFTDVVMIHTERFCWLSHIFTKRLVSKHQLIFLSFQTTYSPSISFHTLVHRSQTLSSLLEVTFYPQNYAFVIRINNDLNSLIIIVLSIAHTYFVCSLGVLSQYVSNKTWWTVLLYMCWGGVTRPDMKLRKVPRG